MAMDAKSEDAPVPKEEVSQDQESFKNVKAENIKIENENRTQERESSNNDDEIPTKPVEKESKDVNFGVATENVKVCEALKIDNEIKGEGMEHKDAGKNEVETNERVSFENFNENRTKSEEKKPNDVKARDENVTSNEKDEKKCEISTHSTLVHLKEHEKEALAELRSKLEEAISSNKLFEGLQKETKEAHDDKSKTNDEKHKDKEEEPNIEIPGKLNTEDEKVKEIEFDKDATLWGVPLLPSKGDERTNVILEKFLMARDFNANEAYEMFRKTLWWRKENKIDSILEEDFGGDYDSVAYMSGTDLEGHPVCYNVYGVFGDSELYNKTFGTEESRQRFLRWRLQMMEKQIQKLNFKPGGVSSLLQINDLENTPGPARKDLRIGMKQAVGTLQENYPEFVHRNIFINVPFWYYAFNALLSPFLAPRTKSKFVFIRPARVTETLLKCVSAAEIPIYYGGLKRENDPDFSIEDGYSDIIVKGGSVEAIEVPAPEEGCNLIWDVTVIGWEVNYKEDFITAKEDSSTVIIQKGRRMGWQEGSVRNSFINTEPGKVVLTIENASFKKKRVLYRYKTIKGSTSSS